MEVRAVKFDKLLLTSDHLVELESIEEQEWMPIFNEIKKGVEEDQKIFSVTQLSVTEIILLAKWRVLNLEREFSKEIGAIVIKELEEEKKKEEETTKI